MKEMDIVNKDEMCMNMLRTDTWEGIKIKCWQDEIVLILMGCVKYY